MNTYPLGVITRLIHEELPKRKNMSKEFNLLRNKVIKETDRIIKDLPQMMSTKKDHTSIETSIQALQKDLLSSMAEILKYLPMTEWRTVIYPASISPSIDGYRAMYQCMERLLSFILQHFSRYMDAGFMAPVGYLESAKSPGAFLFRTEEIFERVPIDQKSKQIICKPFHDLVYSTDYTQKIPYEYLVYLNELKECLIVVLETYKEEELAQKMKELLIYLNFNDNDYFLHVVSLIKQELKAIPTTKMKQNKLYELKNNYEQLPVKPGVNYRPGEPSLKQQLSEWILRQIEHVKLSAADVDTAVISHYDRNYNLFLPVSIDELGCFLYLLYEAEIIRKDVIKKKLAEVVSRHISTKGKEKISAGNLLNKMSKPEARILLSVSKKLEKLIELTKSE